MGLKERQTTLRTLQSLGYGIGLVYIMQRHIAVEVLQDTAPAVNTSATAVPAIAVPTISSFWPVVSGLG